MVVSLQCGVVGRLYRCSELKTVTMDGPCVMWVS